MLRRKMKNILFARTCLYDLIRRKIKKNIVAKTNFCVANAPTSMYQTSRYNVKVAWGGIYRSSEMCHIDCRTLAVKIEPKCRVNPNAGEKEKYTIPQHVVQ